MGPRNLDFRCFWRLLLHLGEGWTDRVGQNRNQILYRRSQFSIFWLVFYAKATILRPHLVPHRYYNSLRCSIPPLFPSTTQHLPYLLSHPILTPQVLRHAHQVLSKYLLIPLFAVQLLEHLELQTMYPFPKMRVQVHKLSVSRFMIVLEGCC